MSSPIVVIETRNSLTTDHWIAAQAEARQQGREQRWDQESKCIAQKPLREITRGLLAIVKAGNIVIAAEGILALNELGVEVVLQLRMVGIHLAEELSVPRERRAGQIEESAVDQERGREKLESLGKILLFLQLVGEC